MGLCTLPRRKGRTLTPKSVMVVGLGEVGQWVLEFLMRRDGVDRIYTADSMAAEGTYRTNATALSGVLERCYKPISFHPVDLNDVAGTAGLLRELRPDVVFASVTRNSWWILQPRPIAPRLYSALSAAGFAVLVPWHATLVHKLMRAVHDAGIDTQVVNASYPDVVGPIVWRSLGYGPVVGIGNHDLVGAELVLRVCDQEGVSAEDVALYFVGSHALGDADPRNGPPYYVKLLVKGEDITARCDVNNWLRSRIAGFTSTVGRNLHIYSYTAASAVKNIMAIVNDTNELIQAPGPNGLVGGYPVRLGAGGATVELPPDLSLSAAVAMNEEALAWDGVERILEDGTLVYTDKTYVEMRELGYECKEVRPDELEARAAELEGLLPQWLAMTE